MSELLDCPFCGCKATFVKHSAGVPGTQGFDKWDAVACKHCRATVGACDRRFRCREDAAAAWNRRMPNSNSAEFDGIRSAAPAAGTEKDAAYDVLKSIIQDGYLSDTNTARGHAAIAAKEPPCS
jgi:hypothetical protein